MTTTTPADERNRASGSSSHREIEIDPEVAAPWVIAVVAAVAAGLAGCQPTGTAYVDPVLTGAFAGLVTLAAARSSRWPLFLPVTASLLAQGWALAPGLISGLIALIGARRPGRSRLWGAATGGLAVQSLVRLPDLGFHGASALVCVVVTVPVLVSGYQKCSEAERRRLRRAGFTLLAAVALIAVAYGVLALSVVGQTRDAVSASRQGLELTRTGETAEARVRFGDAEAEFSSAADRLGGWWAAPARALPVLAQHARATTNLADEGRALAVTAGDTVEAADYERLRYQDGAFDLERIAAVEPPLRQTSRSIASAQSEIAASRSPWLFAPLDHILDDFTADLDDAGAESDLAIQAVDLAPRLLGGEGPRRYLVAFVTPAELRGGGGFFGSYAELSAVDGRLRLDRSGSITPLNRAVPRGSVEITGPPEYLERYGRFDPGDFFGDVMFSPDFPQNAQVIEEIYPQKAGGTEIDGVISMDPIALAALLQLTGPVEVPGFGRTLTSADAAEFLLEENYSLFPDDEAQNDALAELVEITFDRLTTGDLPGPRKLAEVLGPPTDEGRIRLWSPEPAEQALFGRLGATGALPEPQPDHDFLAVASQNSGNNKLDVYQRRTVDYDVDVDDAGRLSARVAVTVHNEVPLDAGIAPYVISNGQGDPLGTNRMLLSIYSPHLLDGARLDGQPIGVESQTEGGYQVYSRLITVPPGGQVTLELALRGTLQVGSGYRLDLAPQPTVTSDRLTVHLSLPGGRDTTTGPLDIIGRRMLAIDPDP